MDSTVRYDKHYAANRFRRTGTTGSRRYGAAGEWRKKPTARELADSAGHAGHLFQQRFKGIVVQKETHFLAVCRYVVTISGTSKRGLRSDLTAKILHPNMVAPRDFLSPIFIYLWNSAKWVRGHTLMHEEKPGFWESLGYHNYVDPWREQYHWAD